MDTNSVLVLIASISGALISGFFTWLAAHTGRRWAKAKNNIIKLSEQVEAYHLLEAQYALYLAEKESRSNKTIKTEFRNRVEKETGIRPNMTKKMASQMKTDWI